MKCSCECLGAVRSNVCKGLKLIQGWYTFTQDVLCSFCGHRSIDVGRVPSLEQLGFAGQQSLQGTGAAGGALGIGRLRGGEREALQHLQAFISSVKGAHARHMREGAGVQGTNVAPVFSCKISPWLALGCVSPRTVSVLCFVFVIVNVFRLSYLCISRVSLLSFCDQLFVCS